MREDIPSYLRESGTSLLLHSPSSIVVHRCRVVLYMCTVCTFSRSLIDRDTVTANDGCSCLISLLTTSM